MSGLANILQGAEDIALDDMDVFDSPSANQAPLSMPIAMKVHPSVPVPVSNAPGPASRTTNVQGKTRKWTPEEDALMIKLVNEQGTKHWGNIGKALQNRTGKQCRERWHNQLDPSINKNPWSQDEEELLIKLHSQLGNKWAEIAKRIPGRTDNTIKNHWNSAKRRLMRFQGIKSGTATGNDRVMGNLDLHLRQGSLTIDSSGIPLVNSENISREILAGGRRQSKFTTAASSSSSHLSHLQVNDNDLDHLLMTPRGCESPRMALPELGMQGNLQNFDSLSTLGGLVGLGGQGILAAPQGRHGSARSVKGKLYIETGANRGDRSGSIGIETGDAATLLIGLSTPTPTPADGSPRGFFKEASMVDDPRPRDKSRRGKGKESSAESAESILEAKEDVDVPVKKGSMEGKGSTDKEEPIRISSHASEGDSTEESPNAQTSRTVSPLDKSVPAGRLTRGKSIEAITASVEAKEQAIKEEEKSTKKSKQPKMVRERSESNASASNDVGTRKSGRSIRRTEKVTSPTLTLRVNTKKNSSSPVEHTLMSDCHSGPTPPTKKRSKPNLTIETDMQKLASIPGPGEEGFVAITLASARWDTQGDSKGNNSRSSQNGSDLFSEKDITASQQKAEILAKQVRSNQLAVDDAESAHKRRRTLSSLATIAQEFLPEGQLSDRNPTEEQVKNFATDLYSLTHSSQEA